MARPVIASAVTTLLAFAPMLAIGGITPQNVGALVEAGAYGVAVSAAVCAAEDPGAIVRVLVESLRKSSTDCSKHTATS